MCPFRVLPTRGKRFPVSSPFLIISISLIIEIFNRQISQELEILFVQIIS